MENKELDKTLEALLVADKDIQDEIRMRLVTKVITPIQYMEEMRVHTINFREALRDLKINQSDYDDVLT